MIITVAPDRGVWAVRCAGLESMLFQSGGRAEAAARRLALAFSQNGHPAKVVVHDGNGTLAGFHRHRPASVYDDLRL
jgi:hypothetical protein